MSNSRCFAGCSLLLLFCRAVAPTGAAAQAQAIDFVGAQWIWPSAGIDGNLNTLPASASYFRAEVNVPEVPALESAEIIVTCDNLFVLHVNGQVVGESTASNNSWKEVRRWDLTGAIAPGRCVLAVEAVNTLPGPAGLIVKFVARLADGKEIVLASDATWKCSETEEQNWQQPDFDDQKWPAAKVVGQFGGGAWGKVVAPATAKPAGEPVGKVRAFTKRVFREAASRGRVGPVEEKAPPADFVWPEAVVFVGEDCSLSRAQAGGGDAYHSLSVTIFNPRNARAFPEHDLPAPMKVGKKLLALQPARPGVKPRVLLDAGRGALGSPSVSFDGQSIFVSMARDGEPFYHIYQLPAAGGEPKRLTDGPFHDIDPAELPDGRIVFTSTRIGTFEEYHNPPSRALFVMQADGSGIWPLTNTIIFDNEPEVLADGRIIFIRSDNFFDRGKVETLLHAIFPDGTEGYTEFGLDNGPEYGGRLRAFVCGSPAPMPDGRLAFVSGPGISVGRPGEPARNLRHFSLGAGDVAALPDGRLLCTTGRSVTREQTLGKKKRKIRDHQYEKICVLDPESRPPILTVIYNETSGSLHSPVSLAPRKRPLVLAERVAPQTSDDIQATGFLYCQNARLTQHDTAGWAHVRAIRVIQGKGLTVRSSHSYIVHAGNETIELGTVPLAPDGSFNIEVPADTPLALQAVDAEGRAELNEMSWIYVRPGERRGCVGCHPKRQVAPKIAGPMSLAAKAPPLRLLGRGEPHHFRGNNAAVTGLMEMQFDRYREVAGINRYAKTSNPAASGAPEVAALVAQLRGQKNGLKISAAQRLAIFRDPAAAPALAECLRDGDREVRVAAALALAACGDRQSVPPLLEALNDPDPLAAQAAAVALENLTGHAEPFNGFAEPGERGALPWRQWFAENNWDKIEQELVARLESHDSAVVRRAAVALGHTGGADCRGALRAYVARERANNPHPEWRKRHSGDGARFNALSEVNPRTLQAATRALGHRQDAEAVALLGETLRVHADPATGNLFLAEAAAEALGLIATPAAEQALVTAFAGLKDYPQFTLWYGDHSALMACHASPVHYFIIQALDTMGSKNAASITPHLIRSTPIDPDRALFLPNDDYENLVGRVIRRNGGEAAVVETCLAILGDPAATRTKEIEQAIGKVIRCWGGHPGPENRAAQILSLVCRDRQYEPRVSAAFERYRAKPVTIPRVFDTGIPVVDKLPIKNWGCFFLARTLGNLDDPRSVQMLIATLEQAPAEAASGHPDPLGPGVLFLHNDLTPCWRAAVAWALGELGDKRATPVLLGIVGDLKNATDTRYAATEALGKIADASTLAPLRKLAADYPEISTRRALLKVCEALAAK